MNIIISNAAQEPIYEQIISQIKGNIISGVLREGELLPSIRNLAKDLKISVITTKRAYEELEREGFIYTVVGKGCFVAEKNMELIREQSLAKIEEHIQAVIEIADMCGLSEDEVLEMYRLMKEELHTSRGG